MWAWCGDAGRPNKRFVMNYFAHGRDFTHDAYFLAGAAVPDWLNVADRKTRVRPKGAALFQNHENPRFSSIARGILQHHADDAWFHRTRAFVELSAHFTCEIAASFPCDRGPRAGFVGHILVEMLLDSCLIEENPAGLSKYYSALEKVDATIVEAAVNAMAALPTSRLALLIPRFLSERFLYDYAENAKLLGRLNAVLRRVGLEPLPASFESFLHSARWQVAERKVELLTSPAPAPIPSFPVSLENAP